MQKTQISDDRYLANILKKRRLLSLEKFLSNSEPAIDRECNGGIPFLSENKIDSEMIDRPQEQDVTVVNNKGARASIHSIGKIIDRVSRFLFPFAFILFNIFYWNHFLNK